MGSYGQYCPISRSAEILGDRWTIHIVRDLLTGSDRFNELIRGNPGLSRALLTRRLRQLETAGVDPPEQDLAVGPIIVAHQIGGAVVPGQGERHQTEPDDEDGRESGRPPAPWDPVGHQRTIGAPVPTARHGHPGGKFGSRMVS